MPCAEVLYCVMRQVDGMSCVERVKAESVGAHEHREAAMASCLMHRYRGLAVLVRFYRGNVCFATAWCH
ncbi:hypothetical protein AUC61_21840 [Pseudomonas sp. S25]|uniref:Uncharacterized protein n=1 Tax=Pseudomonas maioricensis TaxID=1766623 RepID=A0ABS9ZPU8_9PSED|nr:hypothetical protein [Pseudomonas sp. S25]